MELNFEDAKARYEDRSRPFSQPAAAEYHRIRGYKEGWKARDVDATAEVESLREELREARAELHKEWLGPEEWPTITPLERRQERMENLVTVSQAAEMLQVREETVREYIRRGQLPAMALPGGYYRIKPENVEGLLKPKQRKGTNGPQS